MKFEDYKVGMVVRLKKYVHDVIGIDASRKREYLEGELGVITVIDVNVELPSITILWRSDMPDLMENLHHGDGWTDLHHGDDQARMVELGIECCGPVSAIRLEDIEPVIDLLQV